MPRHDAVLLLPMPTYLPLSQDSAISCIDTLAYADYAGDTITFEARYAMPLPPYAA